MRIYVVDNMVGALLTFIYSLRELWRSLWKHLKNVSVLIDEASQYMLDMPFDDDTQYLATKRLLVSPQWRFAHQPEKSEDMANIPLVFVGGNLSQTSMKVHLPGINFNAVGNHMYTLEF